MNQYQAGTAANPPGTGLEDRGSGAASGRGQRGWLGRCRRRARSIHDAEHGARPGAGPA